MARRFSRFIIGLQLPFSLWYGVVDTAPLHQSSRRASKVLEDARATRRPSPAWNEIATRSASDAGLGCGYQLFLGAERMTKSEICLELRRMSR